MKRGLEQDPNQTNKIGKDRLEGSNLEDNETLQIQKPKQEQGGWTKTAKKSRHCRDKPEGTASELGRVLVFQTGDGISM